MRKLVLGLACAAVLASATAADGGEEHWSRQFKWPDASYKMGPGTGMSDGTGKPQIKVVKKHEGKLWFGGHWSPGVSGWNASKRMRNHAWYLWTYSEEEGWRAFAHAHSAQGGVGPQGTIHDFLWLPDGRMVVAGGFTRVNNPGGIDHHRVCSLAVYDPKEPTANKWQPLGTFQLNGRGMTGIIECLAYDPQGNDLYIGGSFAGVRGKESDLKEPLSPGIHLYDFDTKSYALCSPGIKGSKPIVKKIHVDTSTKPSTITIAGGYAYTGGNGLNPSKSKSTARYTAGFAQFQRGKGWTLFPKGGVEASEGANDAILQRAADFMFFDTAMIHDFLIDGEDIWIVGSFSGGKDSGETLRGIAKWDAAKQNWVDPTGKGGVGRECFAIGKADNGKIYFAGAFGGPVAGKYYKGFNNGDEAHMAISYDPKTNTWEQVGTGLQGINQPECRLMVDGNDVYYYGDFKILGKGRTGKGKEKEFQSAFIARWNETRDFVKDPVKVGTTNFNKDYFVPPTEPMFKGTEHWSRKYVRAPRAIGKKSQMSARTGMDVGTGTPEIKGLLKHKDVFYFVGRWEAIRGQNWMVWSYDPSKEQGWEPLAFTEKGKAVGVPSTPEGIKLYQDKLYVYGPIKDYWGVGIYDPATREWSKLEGKTHDGKPTIGSSADPKRGTPVMDMAFDEKTGDIYMVGGMGYHTNPKYDSPKFVGQVIKRNKDGLCVPMGRPLLPQIPAKPVVTVDSIYLDKTKDPVDIYIGGTWGFCGGSKNKTRAYNIAKWDHAKEDWVPLGKGCTLLVSGLSSEQAKYPEGYPGIPVRPEVFREFLNAGFPRVREITMDGEGNLYVGGTMALVDRSVPISERLPKESYGMLKLDAKTDTWVPATSCGGFSRDVFQMTWLDAARTRMLVTGGFHYDNQWSWLGSVCTLDVKTGQVEQVGGGLHVGTRSQLFSSNVRHFVDGDDWYFTGFFDYAGINENDLLAGPVESMHFAHYNATKNMDPNAGLNIAPIDAVERPKTFGSKSYKVTLTAKLEGAPGELTWYQLTTTGQWKKVGDGESYTANVRVKSDDEHDPVFYVTVTRDGIEGGKHPVRIPTK